MDLVYILPDYFCKQTQFPSTAAWRNQMHYAPFFEIRAEADHLYNAHI